MLEGLRRAEELNLTKISLKFNMQGIIHFVKGMSTAP